MGKEKAYETEIDGVKWNVTEIKIALFPTSSGTITVSSLLIISVRVR